MNLDDLKQEYQESVFELVTTILDRERRFIELEMRQAGYSADNAYKIIEEVALKVSGDEVKFTYLPEYCEELVEKLLGAMGVLS